MKEIFFVVFDVLIIAFKKAWLRSMSLTACCLLVGIGPVLPTYADSKSDLKTLYKEYSDGIIQKNSKAVKKTLLSGPVPIVYVDESTKHLELDKIPAHGWASRVETLQGKSDFKIFEPYKIHVENGIAVSTATFVSANSISVGLGKDIAFYVETDEGWRFLGFNRTWLRRGEKSAGAVAEDSPDVVVSKMVEAMNARNQKAFKKCFIDGNTLFAHRKDLLDGKSEKSDLVSSFGKRFKNMSTLEFELIDSEVKIFDSHIAYLKGKYSFKSDSEIDESGDILIGLIVGNKREWKIMEVIRN